MFRWSFAYATLVTFALSIAPETNAFAANRFVRGVVFGSDVNSSAPPYRVVHVFTHGVDGSFPNGTLLKDTAGALYGVTANGGNQGAGTVFKLTPPAAGETAWTETVLHSFSSAPHGGDGCDPSAGLRAYGGELYGTTYGCGPGGFGTVFRLTPPPAGRTGWKLTVLHAFADSPDGAHPEAPLLEYGGALYSTTFFGGAFRHGCSGDGCGTVFRLTPTTGKTAWTESVIHSFNTGDGANPIAGLIVDPSGTLYGTTFNGGSRNNGTVFSLSPPTAGRPAWTLTELTDFAGTAGSPSGPAAPVLAFHGALYGTTTVGGAYTNGTIFKLSPAGSRTHWNESTLYSFGNPPDGAYPSALSVDAHGNFYGAASLGGRNGFGTVFKLTPPTAGSTTWRESITHTFAGVGGAPFGGLTEYSLGTFYGTTAGNGPILGTVYEIKM